MPGPLIEANWGDTIVVHVRNSILDNGTSLHFHGIRQNYTNEMDGVASITQCALAPGEEMTLVNLGRAACHPGSLFTPS